MPFYSDPEMTDHIGTLTLYGISIPSTEFPSFFHCDITFCWHGPDQNLTDSDTMLTMTGIMIQGDPADGADQAQGAPFLQLFAITGGTGQYVGAKGKATIDPSLGLQDYQIEFA
ncbi:MAG: hypothetical protein JJ896_07075 [Rhodothermales bacterium]|nr:hypothetical protein [Rhodothermales bacterium]